MTISFATSSIPADGTLVLPVSEGRALTPAGQAVDEATGGALGRAMAAARFEGKAEQQAVVLAPHGVGLDRVVLLGIGKAGEFDALKALKLGGRAVRSAAGAAAIAVDISGLDGDQAALAAEVALGARLRAWRFDRYRSKKEGDDAPVDPAVTVMSGAGAEAAGAFEARNAAGDGVDFTRELISEPANVLTPRNFMERLKDLARLGIDVEVLDRDRMAALGMNALLGVAQGSVNEPYLVIMRWTGREDDGDPVAFVGKGVCFDSGGISIKPAGGMEEMKWDMGGAGIVAGLLRTLAQRKARVNVVGVVGLVENMPSGTAQRPGDVVTSLSGQTIEVINTDAEGLLVLADALAYTRDRFKPSAIVDLATLTGAIIVALGTYNAGLFANDDGLANALLSASAATGEGLWRLPLSDAYDKDINSDIADMKNVGKGRDGGSITAAQFLKRFVGDTPWAHLDVAGVVWGKGDTDLGPKGATGYGVRLLDRLVADRFEAGA